MSGPAYNAQTCFMVAVRQFAMEKIETLRNMLGLHIFLIPTKIKKYNNINNNMKSRHFHNTP
jgi:hypothetical protein